MAKKKNKNPGAGAGVEASRAHEDDELIDLSDNGEDDESLAAGEEALSAVTETFGDNQLSEESAEMSDELDDEEDDGMLAELSAEGDDDALAEFKDYDSLDEEYPEDELDAAEEISDELSGILTPKERRLMAMTLESRVEAILFASNKPMKAAEIHEILADESVAVEHVEATLANLMEFYDSRCGGFRLHYLKRLGFQFQTSDNAGAIMEKMFASRPRPISRAALETLAIIAYRQPVTRAEVEFIRGVDAGSIFKTLLERDLIKCTGRKEIVGRPMLFGTTDDFLKVFNLSSIKDLPPLEAFQPAREMVQGAMEKIAEGDDDLVDIEQYIADNTGGDVEAAAEGEEAGAAEGLESRDSDTEQGRIEASRHPEAEPKDLEAATDEEPNFEDLLESVAEELHGAGKDKKSERTFGATKDAGPAAEQVTEQPAEDTDGTDSDTEVAFSDGDSVPERGGDLDN
jgi:segregation and condensation protein B